MKKTILFFLTSLIVTIHLHAKTSDAQPSTKPNSSEPANQYIDVGTPNAKKMRLAIPTFYLEKAAPITKIALSDITNRFKEILDFTNWFYFIPNDAFLSSTHPVTRPFKVGEWKIIQADFVVFGQLVQKSKNRFDLQLRAINVATQNTASEKIYSNLLIDFVTRSKNEDSRVSPRRMTGGPADLDLALRDFSDALIQAVTGTPGPCMTQITFVGRSIQNARKSDIYIADFDGGHAFSITKNNTINLSPSWSPDGKNITYTSFKTGKAEIFEYNLDTQKTTQITFENANSSGANWNNTGDLIAFSSSTPQGATNIYTITGAGDPKEPLVTSNGIAVEPAFSPSGKYLAYTSNKYSKPMIFLYNFENNATTRLTYAGWYNASAAWSPDSEQLAFASFDRDIDRWDLFKIDVDGSGLERFTLKQGDNEKPSWSPDGRFIVFQSNRGEPPNQNTIKGNPYKLYYMSSDGMNQKIIHTAVYDSRQPAWGPRLPFINNN